MPFVAVCAVVKSIIVDVVQTIQGQVEVIVAEWSN